MAIKPKNNRPIVTIVQRRLTHYRVPLFEQMRALLAQSGISLRVLIGEAQSGEAQKNDEGILDWAEKMPTRYLLSGRLCWQPVRRMTAGSDLTIITQENALLANHSFLLRPPSGKLAFWGHGANFQSTNRNSLSERYKRWTTRQVNWWFAYTSLSVDLVASAGFDPARITCLNNAIDTTALVSGRGSVTQAETNKLRAELGLPENGFTGVFIGSLYTHKRLDMLIAAGELIQKHHPEFSLVIIGTGPQESYIRAQAETRPWLFPVGPKQGSEKALYLSLGSVMLNPGLVGLNILDSFAYGLPMITTDCGLHSPEIAYLDEDVGLMTQDTKEDFAAACIALADNPAKLNSLKGACMQRASTFTIEAMAERFVDGIQKSLMHS